jgi:ketosteroid isomerase-like protein
MSEQNVQLHRRANEAFNARDLEAFMAIADPSIEFHSVFSEIHGVYRGYDGMRTYRRDVEDAWEGGRRVEPEAYFDLGEHTLVFQRTQASGQHSGADVTMPMAHVCRWRDGLCVYMKAYVHREDALRDLGVLEDSLEPIAP